VDRPAFKVVLEGRYIPPLECTPITIKLLENLCQLPTISEIKLGGVEEFSKDWQKAREQTASSPSQVHFGHYIAGMFNLEIAIINSKMAEWPQQLGKPLHHWMKGLNVMLEKIPGNCSLDKLQIIVLFKADFNYNNKRLGWVVMISAEQAGLLAPEQYGSRKHKSANLQCLNK